MIPVEVLERSHRVQNFYTDTSNEGRRMNFILLDEVRDKAWINFEALKRRIEHNYKTKVNPRQFKVVDLVMRRACLYQIENKLSPKWSDTYRITKVLGNGAYRLKILDDEAIPSTRNAINLKFYFSLKVC